MQPQSLSELRESIASEEVEENKLVVEAESEAEAETVEEPEEAKDGEESQEAEANAEAEGGEKPEWAKTEGQSVPVAKYVDLKHKLKANKIESEGEIERLRQENEALKRGQPQQMQTPKAPTLAECEWDEAVFAQKNAEYVDALIESKLTSHSQKAQSQRQAQQAEQGLKKELDKHYERASEFVKKGVVSEENFRNADAIVRRTVQEVFPESDGDLLTDALIANLGEGSEKVLYHLGANPAALALLEQALRTDPHGLKASSYLGGLKAKFEATTLNKLSNAPKPDVSLKGNASLVVKSKQSDYDKALAKGDVTLARTIKKAAAAGGADISNW